MDIKILMRQFALLVLLLLSACQQTRSPLYLMQHIDVLKKELAYCQDNQISSSHCDQVKEIAAEFYMLANSQREEPLAFGQQILQAEQEAVTAKHLLDQAQQSANASLPETKQNIEQAKQAYEIRVQKVQKLLAVVGAMSTPGL